MSAVAIYINEKYRHELQWENYVADCLWTSATGRKFSNKNGDATLPRWFDIVNPSEKKDTPKPTKDSVRAKFSRLKNRNIK